MRGEGGGGVRGVRGVRGVGGECRYSHKQSSCFLRRGRLCWRLNSNVVPHLFDF